MQKISNEEFIKFWQAALTRKELAKKYNVSGSCIQSVIKRETYKHVV